jgi:hypothetical protein
MGVDHHKEDEEDEVFVFFVLFVLFVVKTAAADNRRLTTDNFASSATLLA